MLSQVPNSHPCDIAFIGLGWYQTNRPGRIHYEVLPAPKSFHYLSTMGVSGSHVSIGIQKSSTLPQIAVCLFQVLRLAGVHHFEERKIKRFGLFWASSRENLEKG